MSNEDLINSLKQALEVSPDNVPLILQIANLQMAQMDYEGANGHFSKALQLQPGDPDVTYSLARCCYFQQKFSQAIIMLEQLNFAAMDGQAELLYAKALLKEGSTAKSLEVYQKLVANRPGLKDDELDAQFRSGMMDAPDDEEIDEDALRMLQKPDVNFDNVGGMQHVKEEIGLKIIQPLQNPDLYKAYGKKIGGGILLYGPPGCGKTHLAKATAGQIDASFINIGINDVLDMWIGNSEKNLHEIFELARRNTPCVLFFDEVDALGASRSDMRQSNSRQLINQFLSELDGIEADNDGVLILAATNAPWHLDPAFRRPGRFDRIIFVQPPDQVSREAILKVLLDGKPVADIDYEAIAKKTKEFSGADLQGVIDRCIEDKLKASFSSGVPEPMTTKDLLKAVKASRPSTKEWFGSAKNYALYANESGLYDDVLNYINKK